MRSVAAHGLRRKYILDNYMGLIKDLVKILDEIKFQAGVGSNYSHEIHMDPDKKELREELEEIIKKIDDIEMYLFTEIKDNVIQLQYELNDSDEEEEEESK